MNKRFEVVYDDTTTEVIEKISQILSKEFNIEIFNISSKDDSEIFQIEKLEELETAKIAIGFSMYSEVVCHYEKTPDTYDRVNKIVKSIEIELRNNKEFSTVLDEQYKDYVSNIYPLIKNLL